MPSEMLFSSFRKNIKAIIRSYLCSGKRTDRTKKREKNRSYNPRKVMTALFCGNLANSKIFKLPNKYFNHQRNL